MIDYYLTPNEQYFSYTMTRTSYIRWGDNDIRFVLDQHAWFDFYSASSMKRQLIGKYISSLGHIILISSQSVFTPSAARLAEKQHILIWLSFVWSDRVSPRYKLCGTIQNKKPNTIR